MTATGKSDATYVLGDSAHERRRLQEQSNLVNPFTYNLLINAGIKPGMRVLDVGCGAGDVTMLLADLVGMSGSVVSLDKNGALAETVQQRATTMGYTNILFTPGDVLQVDFESQFDAVVGRLVLLYLANPTEALVRVTSFLRPGGIVAFQEVDFTTAMVSVPRSPLADQIRYWIVETFKQAGMELQMGFKLHDNFVKAGLPEPQMHLDALIGGSRNWGGYVYAVNTLKSVLPYVEKFGIATTDEIGIDTLAERFQAEIVDQSGTVMLSTWVSAWTQKPHKL